ncbi:hypothetical protein PGT21_036720 [Puccinia graminis f. sp. tritici]|uniref:Hydrophobin n=1 Tax=Puccinia graminis f. sp. tritici TaxID=56615 RepID=A0A5B0R377_PUCGR|nr:hypothetical protein PGT21_036720 [Puccinia graminis f. sp. tritici]
MQFSNLMIVFLSVALQLVAGKDAPYIFSCDKLTKDGKPVPQAICGIMIPDPKNPVPSQFSLVQAKMKLDSKRGYAKNNLCEDSGRVSLCCFENTATFDKSHTNTTRPLKLVEKQCVAPSPIAKRNTVTL